MIKQIHNIGSDHSQSSWQLGHRLRVLAPTDTVTSICDQSSSTIAKIDCIELEIESKVVGFTKEPLLVINLPDLQRGALYQLCCHSIAPSRHPCYVVLDNAKIHRVLVIHQ